jgi:predicted ferric reductase
MIATDTCAAIEANPMLPSLARLVESQDQGEEIKLMRLELLNGGSEAFRAYKPGQFAFLSAFGVGEAPFGIANSHDRGPHLDFAVQRLGGVTTALHEMGPGDTWGCAVRLGIISRWKSSTERT